MPYEFVTLKQKPCLETQIDQLQTVWPQFMLHGNMRHWSSLFNTFAEYQIAICDPPDIVIAVGHAIPFVWDGTLEDLPPNMDAIMERAVQAHRQRQPSTTLSALAAIVARDHQGQGLSTNLIRAMKTLAAEHGLGDLVAPVRPTLKSFYPTTPIERYMQWKREDGSPFDPWLRVHWRLGAKFMKVIKESFIVTGTVADWEEWTGMRFPDNGEYIVPGALCPIIIDRDRDIGSYVEPNVWMQHPVTAAGIG
jgi:hypothetical protein